VTCGTVRLKRLASAVGEGAMAVAFVNRYLDGRLSIRDRWQPFVLIERLPRAERMK